MISEVSQRAERAHLERQTSKLSRSEGILFPHRSIPSVCPSPLSQVLAGRRISVKDNAPIMLICQQMNAVDDDLNRTAPDGDTDTDVQNPSHGRELRISVKKKRSDYETDLHPRGAGAAHEC